MQLYFLLLGYQGSNSRAWNAQCETTPSFQCFPHGLVLIHLTLALSLFFLQIFLAQHYRESFDQIFKNGQVPDEPSFYVNVPSRVDPSAAPKGGDTIVVLVPCGPIADEGNAPEGYKDKETFAKIKERVKSQVLATIQARIGKDIGPLIREEHVLDPWDWREKFGLWNGSILGLSHCVSQVLWFRPSNQ